MIHSIEFNDLKRACVPWVSSSKWLSGLKRLRFGPGVNLVYGPNGAGKTAMLKSISRPLYCEQGGVQKITSYASQNMSSTLSRRDWLNGVLPVHDGAPVVCVDPAEKYGLIGGSFDDDFFEEGFINASVKSSAGQAVSRRLMASMMMLTGKKAWPELETAGWAVKLLTEEEQAFLRGNYTGDEPKRPALLLDEPTKGLDLRTELSLWEGLVRHAKRSGTQIIAATHSIAPLFMKNITLIETELGYIDLCAAEIGTITSAWAARGSPLPEVTTGDPDDRRAPA